MGFEGADLTVIRLDADPGKGSVPPVTQLTHPSVVSHTGMIG
jgi:hypothetical protein